MKIKFNQTETKNKIIIQIKDKINTKNQDFKNKLEKIKLWKNNFKVESEKNLDNNQTIIFVKVKNESSFQQEIEDIIISLGKIIKSEDKSFSINLKNLKLNPELEEMFIELLAQNFYKFTKFIQDKSKYEINIKTNLDTNKLQTKIKNIYWARDLINMPANYLNPDTYEEIIKDEFKNLPVEITVIKWEELKKIEAGGIYSVGKGSIHQPKMIVLKYQPKPDKPFFALVWKGVTFDSGGYNIKPTWYMEDMNMDMGWSAISLGIFKYLVENNYQGNLICAIWTVENLVSQKSYTPTDIIKMYNWKTVRGYNTDAEWRLVLADVLSYVEKNYEIEEIFDFATLTWAAIVALWNDIMAIMGRNKKNIKKIEGIGWNIKERAWELPFYEKYKKQLKSDFADISNCTKWRAAWTITAWLFLSEFVKNKNWIHFDIAWVDILENHPLYGNWWSWIGIRLIIKYLVNKSK